MNSVIKDLKMIDFLGMILPGFAIAILFCFECKVWTFFAECFDEDIGLIAKFTFIAILSYVIGMLLHEIGDITEKTLWINPLLNPRTYAALSTGYIITYVESNKEALQNNCNYRFPWLKKLLVLIEATIFAIPAALLIYFAFQNMYGLAIIIVFVLIPTFLYPFRFLSIIKLFSNWSGFMSLKTCDRSIILAEAVKSICRNDATIMYQAQIAYDNQNDILRRRSLFDGFRTMARNSFIAITFIRIYAIITDSILSEIVRELFQNPVYSMIIYLFISVLLLRYWHYSLLRYKYIYEDIIYGAPCSK